MYQQIANNAISKSTQCATSKNCKAVNCPFESFPESYGIDCIPIHQLNLLNGITDNNLLPDFNTKNTYCFNFGFEGDGNTSAINGRNFLFPPAPLQLSQNGIPNKCILTTDKNNECDNNRRLVTPNCLCTHVRDIAYGASYRFVFTAVGPKNYAWNFAHPIHLHGHSFHVAKIGFGDYSDTGRIMSASEDITCYNNNDYCTDPRLSENVDEGRKDNKAPLKDTVLIPAGGYAIVYFKANNPGYWFLHCHIEVHQLEGMAVVINEAGGMHNPPPTGMPQCGEFTWSIEQFEDKINLRPLDPVVQVDHEGWTRYYYALFVTFCTFFVIAVAIAIATSVIIGIIAYFLNKRNKK